MGEGRVELELEHVVLPVVVADELGEREAAETDEVGIAHCALGAGIHFYMCVGDAMDHASHMHMQTTRLIQ